MAEGRDDPGTVGPGLDEEDEDLGEAIDDAGAADDYAAAADDLRRHG